MKGKTKTTFIDGYSRIKELSHVDSETTIVNGFAQIKKLITVGNNSNIIGSSTIDEIIMNLTGSLHLGENTIGRKIEGKAKTVDMDGNVKITESITLDSEKAVIRDNVDINDLNITGLDAKLGGNTKIKLANLILENNLYLENNLSINILNSKTKKLYQSGTFTSSDSVFLDTQEGSLSRNGYL